MSDRPKKRRTMAAPSLRGLLRQIDPALLEMSEEELAALLSRGRPAAPRPVRWQDPIIEEQIPAGSAVLDLGCGGGELLARLIQNKQVRGQGIELNPDGVFQCVARGVPVFQANLDEGVKELADQSFDYIVLEETLQTLHNPMAVLNEMLRVGRRGIVSFPNFAHWRVRLDLVLRGRMPETDWLPYRWYDTPNIHLFSLQDFLDWSAAGRAKVAAAWVLADGQVRPMRDGDNLHAEEAMLVVEK